MWSFRGTCSINRRLSTHEYSIVMAMIRTLDLHNFISTNMRTSQAERIHRCFGSRITETYLLNWCKSSNHLLCQIHCIRTGQRIETAFAKLVPQCLYQHWVRVTNKQTPKTKMKVYILITIDIPNTATFSAIDEKRIRGNSLK